MKRHFEKPSGLFRRFETRGAALTIAIGKAGQSTTRVRTRLRSARDAEKLAERWAQWALDAGFAEIPLERGTPGIVFHLVSPRGPGRVRDDEGRYVHFAAGALDGRSLALGRRVLLEGVRTNPRLEVGFMLGSKLEARRVLPFPAPAARALAPRRLDARARRALLREAADALSGKQKRTSPLPELAPGSLIFAYERGVHRFLKRTKLPRVGVVVLHEPVLASKLEPQSGEVLTCIPDFCERVPSGFARELATKLGL